MSTPTEPHVLALKVLSESMNDSDIPEYILPLKTPPRNAAVSDVMPLAILWLPDADEAASFYEAAFGAYEFCFEQVFKRLPFTKELSINGRCVLINEDPDWTYPEGYLPACSLKVEDVDAAVDRALCAGGYLLSEIRLSPVVNWRLGLVKDAFGYVWQIYEVLEEKLVHCGGGLKTLISYEIKGF